MRATSTCFAADRIILSASASFAASSVSSARSRSLSQISLRTMASSSTTSTVLRFMRFLSRTIPRQTERHSTRSFQTRQPFAPGQQNSPIHSPQPRASCQTESITGHRRGNAGGDTHKPLGVSYERLSLNRFGFAGSRTRPRPPCGPGRDRRSARDSDPARRRLHFGPQMVG